jgi:hypothetical protein
MRRQAPIYAVEIVLTTRPRQTWRLGEYHQENEARAIARGTIRRMQGWLQVQAGVRQYRQIFPPTEHEILADAESRGQH